MDAVASVVPAVVCFDASGVLFTNGTRILIERLATETGADRAALSTLFSGPESWALRRGEIEAGAFWAWIGPRLQAATGLDAEMIRRAWLACFEPHPGMVVLLEHLAAAGFALGVIAETTAERAADLERRLHLDRLLQHRFLSFEQGADKRDGALFALAAAALPAGVPRIMVEDEPASAAFAAAAGFTSLIYRSAAGIAEDLQELGFSTDLGR